MRLKLPVAHADGATSEHVNFSHRWVGQQRLQNLAAHETRGAREQNIALIHERSDIRVELAFYGSSLIDLPDTLKGFADRPAKSAYRYRTGVMCTRRSAARARSSNAPDNGS